MQNNSIDNRLEKIESDIADINVKLRSLSHNTKSKVYIELIGWLVFVTFLIILVLIFLFTK